MGGEVGVKAQWTHFGQFMGRASKVRGLARMLPQKPSKQGARLFERLTTTCIRRAWVAPLPLRGPSLLSCQRLARRRSFLPQCNEKRVKGGVMPVLQLKAIETLCFEALTRAGASFDQASAGAP